MGLFGKKKFNDLTEEPVQQPVQQEVPLQELPEIEPPQENPHKELLEKIANHLIKTANYIISKLKALE